MQLTSPWFLFIYLPVSVSGAFLLARRAGVRAAMAWTTAASLLFYGWGRPGQAAAIVCLCLASWTVARCMARSSGAARAWLAVGIAANLAAVAAGKFLLPGNLMPLALSFVAFQLISFLVDLRRGAATADSFEDFLFYVTFFPRLLAGPITRYAEVIPQARSGAAFRFDSPAVAEGGAILVLGLFKKLCLADTFAWFADPVFAAAGRGEPLTLFVAWQGTIGYTLQIYFDFSGYSDMAIGMARMFGIRLPDNFLSPYRSASVIEFWRRWHITLSRFLRDYLYIPLGGNRKGPARQAANVMATMLLGGIWHGAGWTFALWGALHGAFLVVNHLWRRATAGWAASLPFGPLRHAAAVAVTFLAVAGAWVAFRVDSVAAAMRVWRGMAGADGAVLPSQIVALIPWVGGLIASAGTVPVLGRGTVLGVAEFALLATGGLALVFFARNLYELTQRWRLALVTLTFGFVLQAVLFPRSPREFIYFRF